LFKMLDK